jgi:hypothetical protein
VDLSVWERRAQRWGAGRRSKQTGAGRRADRAPQKRQALPHTRKDGERAQETDVWGPSQFQVRAVGCWVLAGSDSTGPAPGNPRTSAGRPQAGAHGVTALPAFTQLHWREDGRAGLCTHMFLVC